MRYAINPNWRTHISKDVNKRNDGKTVLISGWVQQIRDKGRLIFLTIRDQFGICQVTLHQKKVSPETWDKAKKLTIESVASFKGIVKSDERSKLGAELIPTEIMIHSIADPKFPIDLTKKKTQMDVDTIFRFRELSIRDPKVVAVMEVKSIIAQATRSYYSKKGFYEIFTPYILTASTEGGAEQFKLDYFGQPAVLAQSCQFYKQASLACHEKVFGIIPSWRAEKSHTPKHITEFHQIETEIAFATDKELIEVQEDLIVNVFKEVKKKAKLQLETLEREIKIPKKPFKKLTFQQAKDLLPSLDVEEPSNEDFGSPAETALSNHFEDPFFITEFPTALRGMYYAQDPDNPLITKSLDLIAPEGFGELSSGGQRVASYESLIKRIKAKGFDPKSFTWYLRMFQYGMPPHAGFGLGFERLVRWVANLPHIREATMFPRTPEICTP
ncbi:MAG: aspartate--tRNA(Asn) ligase [Candidatus Hodarchaeales archaeon]